MNEVVEGFDEAGRLIEGANTDNREPFEWKTLLVIGLVPDCPRCGWPSHQDDAAGTIVWAYVRLKANPAAGDRRATSDIGIALAKFRRLLAQCTGTSSGRWGWPDGWDSLDEAWECLVNSLVNNGHATTRRDAHALPLSTVLPLMESAARALAENPDLLPAQAFAPNPPPTIAADTTSSTVVTESPGPETPAKPLAGVAEPLVCKTKPAHPKKRKTGGKRDTKIKIRCDKILVLLDACTQARYWKLTAKDISEKTRIPYSTLCKLLKHPDVKPMWLRYQDDAQRHPHRNRKTSNEA